jgi:1,4-dihydroxy-2-naphthoyl-CoA hydrolase
MYRYETHIRLADTDAAGVVYFASLLRIAHEAYEAWLHDAGLPIATVISDRPYALPIVHADVDLKLPLRLGDRVVVDLTVGELGERSYTIAYGIAGPHGLAGSARTTHVAISRDEKRSIPLPAEVRQILSA